MKGNNIASQIGVRLEDTFVSKNVINLSRRNLSASEISLLSKGLTFMPTANKIDRAKLKTELEKYEGNYGLCDPLEMMSDPLHLIYLDLNLLLIQGKRMSS